MRVRWNVERALRAVAVSRSFLYSGETVSVAVIPGIPGSIANDAGRGRSPRLAAILPGRAVGNSIFRQQKRVCVLLRQNQFSVLGYAQAVVFALVANQDFLMALE
ncbi:hypothetical protein [Thiobacillus sp.]|uniref:hypothetical protein n=1 Tax=Thiobacillus sp. TaxID=924 RepID=UPI003455E9B7